MSTRSFTSRLAALALVLGAARLPILGCTSSSSASAGGSATLAQTLCAKLSQCEEPILLVSYGDIAACEAQQTATIAFLETLPGSGLNAATASSCTQTLASMNCGSFVVTNPPGVTDLGATCAIAGTVPVQGGCQDDTQCPVGTWCTSGAAPGCLVCTPYATAGDSCASTKCAPGLTCSLGNVCESLPSVGEPCDASAGCAGLQTTCQTGVCAPPLAAGAVCDAEDDPAIPQCDVSQELTCDWSALTCTAPPVVTDGGTCTSTYAPILCPSGSVCRGTCVPVPTVLAVGAACSPDADAGSAECPYAALCTNGVCTLQAPRTCQ